MHAVGDQPRLEPPPEEAEHPVLLHHGADHLGVADHVREGLPRGLDHAEGVGGGVGDQAGAEADQGVAAELLQGLVLGRSGDRLL